MLKIGKKSRNRIRNKGYHLTGRKTKVRTVDLICYYTERGEKEGRRDRERK